MAKLSIIPLPEQPLKNKEIPIYIRLSHGKSRALYATEYSISPKRVKDNKILDTGVLAEVTNNILMPMLEKMNKIANISELSAKQVMELISQRDSIEKVIAIDFLSFTAEEIKRITDKKRTGTANNYITIHSALRDYINRDTLYTSEITLKFLEAFSEHLQSERQVTRMNQGKLKTYKKPAISNQTLNNYIKDFRTLFNACRDKFNDLDIGIINIPNYPFKKYKFKKIERVSGFRSIDIEDIRKISNLDPENLLGRERLARDMYLLSFYLIGINPTDLYDLSSKDIKGNRINYCRNKTKGRRADRAFISIEVPALALEIINRYKGKERLLWLNIKYSHVDTLIRAVNKGLEKIHKKCGLSTIDAKDFTWYSARHTWASIARNQCNYSLEDVGLALNHSADNVTDGYVKRDWSIIDKMNQKVLEKCFGKKNIKK